MTGLAKPLIDAAGLTPSRHLAFRDRCLGSISSVGVLCALGMALLATPAPVRANPAGGTVVGGQATITQTGPNTLQIQQLTPRAAINWNSFNIGAGETTIIQQPNSSSVSLDRVIGSDPSSIAGQLKSNGQVILINPNGIVFTQGSEVDVNSLIATTANVRNADFMAGKLNFSQPSTKPGAVVANEGHISIADYGLAALVAPSVANSGLIDARLGKVVLAGANAFTVDLYGDGLFSFDITSKVQSSPANGALVSNTGTIIADGGQILLTADAVSGIIDDTIRVDGVLQAKSIGSQQGSIIVDAGAGGAAKVTGFLDVSGGPTASAGSATITGNSVALLGNAAIDATGLNGGTVKIGGGAHGTDATVRDAQTTFVAGGAAIDASAVGSGQGGNVTVWSNQATGFAGKLFSRGGAAGGNAEISSAGLLQLTGLVDLSSPTKGKSGTLLLDPAELTICAENGTTCPTSGSFDMSGNYMEPSATTSILDVTTLLTELNTTNVSISTHMATTMGNGQIEIASGFTYTGPAHSLTITAEEGLTVDSGVTISSTNAALNLSLNGGGGATTLTAGSSILTNGGSLALTGSSIAIGGSVSTNNSGATAGGTIQAGTAGALTISSGASVLSVGTIALDAQTMSLGAQIGGSAAGAGQASLVTLAGPAASTIAVGSGTGISTGLLLASTDLLNIRASAVTIGDGTAGAITVGSFDATGSGSAFTAGTGGLLTLQTNGSVSLAGALKLPESLTVSAGSSSGSITDNSGTGSVAVGAVTTLAAASGSPITLSNTANQFGTLAITSGDVVALTSGDTALALGNISTSGAFTLTGGGTITQVGSTTISAAGANFKDGAGAVTLTNTGNIFNSGGVGSLAVTGGTVMLKSADTALSLGNIDATGSFQLTSSGPITQASGTSITIGGGGTFNAGTNDITLDNGGNSFVALAATGGTIEIASTDTALSLANINASGAFTLTGGGTLTQAGSTTISAAGANFKDGAGAVTLTNTGNIFNSGGVGSLAVTGGTVMLKSADTALSLGNIDATGSFQLTSSGPITQASGTSITIGGGGTFNAGTNDITLNNGGNSFVALAATGGNIKIASTDTALSLADISATGTFKLTGGGTLTQAGSTTISAAGATFDDSTGAVTLTNTGNIFNSGGTGNLSVTGGTVMLKSADTALSLGTIDATGSFQLTSSGPITQASGTSITIGGGGTFNAGTNDITLDNGGNSFVALAATGGTIKIASTDTALLLANISATGAFTLKGGGTLTQAGSTTISAAGATLNDGTAAVTLTNTGNIFNSGGVGSLAVTGGTVMLKSADTALSLGTVDTSGSFQLTSSGPITQASGTSITIGGGGTFNAGTNDITLDNSGNSFVALAATGGTIEIASTDTALSLANINATGTFTLSTTGGSITQANGATITAAGGGFDAGAGDITLTNAGNDLTHGGTSSLALNGGDISIANANALTLGAVTAGSLTVTMPAITTLTISGPVHSTGDITLTTDLISIGGQLGGTAAAGSQAADVTIAPVTSGRLIQLGGTNLGSTLFIDPAAATDIRATNVTIGSSSAGSIVTGAFDATGGSFTTGGGLFLISGDLVTVSGALKLPGNLSIAAPGAITDSSGAGSISIAGTLALSTASNAQISLTNNTNSFSGLAVTGGDAVSLFNAGTGTLTIGSIDATGAFSLTTGGGITQAGGASFVADGTTLHAGGDITIANGGNSFTSLVASGGALTFASTDSLLTLGTISASGALGVTTTNGTITQAASTTITASGANFAAGTGDVTLTQTGNSFSHGGAGVLTASGGTISIASSDTALGIGSMDAAGTLALSTTGGSITQASGTTITASGASFDAVTGNISLGGTGNQFAHGGSGTLALTGGTVTVVSADPGLSLGTINAGGAFMLTTGGTITQASGATITAAGGSLNAGTGDITLTNSGNDLTHNGTGSLVLTGADVSITNGHALNLDAVTADSLTVTMPANALLSLQGAVQTAGDITLTTDLISIGAQLGGTATPGSQAASVTIDPVSSGRAIQIGGTDGAPGSDLFIASVGDIQATNVTIGNGTAGLITIGGFDATGGGAFTTGGLLTLVSNGGVSLTGAMHLPGDLTIDTSGAITESGAGLLSLPGTATLSLTAGSTSNITLGNASNLFSNVTVISGNAVTLFDGEQIVLGSVNASGLLTINTQGSLSLNASSSITSAGASLTATGAIDLSGVSNNFESQPGTSLSAQGTSVTIANAGALTVGNLTATNGAVTVETGGTLTATGGTIKATTGVSLTSDSAGLVVSEAVLTTGTVALTADTMTIGAQIGGSAANTGQASQITIETKTAGRAIALGGSSDPGAGGDLFIASSGMLDLRGTNVLIGSQAIGSASGAITLQALPGASSQLAAGGTLTLATGAGVTVTGAVTLPGSLLIEANGTIGDSSGAGSLGLPGTLTLIAGTGNDIVLNSNLNSFGAVTVTSGRNVSLHDGSTLTLGTIDADGSLTLVSAGSIGQSTGTTVTAAGTTVSVSGNITLTNAGNDFESQPGTLLSASGGTIAITNGGAVALSNVNASGGFTLTAGGPITQLAATSIVAGSTTLNASGSITLTNSGNNFDIAPGGGLAASGTTIAIGTANSVALGQIGASGALTVATSGNLTQLAGTAVTANGATLAATGAITLTNASNDFETGSGTLLSLSGSSIGLANTGNLALGNVSTPGALTLAVSGGSLIQTAGTSIGAGGNTVLTAAGAITYGAISTPGALTLIASGGNLTQMSGTSVGAGTATLTAAGAATIGNMSTPGAFTLTASGGDVTQLAGTNISAGTATLTAAGAATLGNISTPGALTLTASGGNVTQLAGTSISVGTATLNAAGAVTLTNAGNMLDTAGGNGLAVTAASIDIVNAGGLTLGAISTPGGLSLTAASLNQLPGSAVTADHTSLTASGAITLDNGGNDFATGAGGFLTASGSTISITNGGSLAIGDIDATGTLSLRSVSGNLGQAGGTTITASGATLVSTGALVFTNQGNNFEAGGGTVTASSGTIELANGGSLVIGNINASGAFSVAANGALSQAAGTTVTSAGATISAAGAITLANAGNNFTTAPGSTLSVSGTSVDLANAGNLSLGMISLQSGTSEGGLRNEAGTDGGADLVLTSGGSITQGAGSAIVTNGASLTAKGDVILTNGGNNFEQAGGTLSVSATNIQITSNAALSLGSMTAANAVVINAGGAITQVSGTGISASSFSGSSVGGATFNQANQIATLAGFTNSGDGGFSFTNVPALTVSAPINAGSGTLALTTIGAGSNLTLASTLTAGASVALNATGSITETNGLIVAPTLSGSAGGNVTLEAANQIQTLASFNTGGTMNFSAAGNLNIAGTVKSGGDMTLDLGGSLNVPGNLSTSGTLTLDAGGSIKETGSIFASFLTGHSAGGADLSGANAIATIGNFQNSGGGPLAIDDNIDVQLRGTLQDFGGRISVTTKGALFASGFSANGLSVLLDSDGGITLSGGNFTASDRVILTTHGLFTAMGTLNVASPLLIIDVTGAPVATMLTLADARPAALVNEIDPGPESGLGTLNLGNLQAPNTTALLILGEGKARGQINIEALGVIGINGGSAGLEGSVGGLSGGAAAEIAVRSGAPDNAFQLNACAIGNATCVVLPLFVPIVPQQIDTIELSNSRQKFDDPTLERLDVGDEDDL